MSEYQPIACGLHEQYQYAVIKKRRLDLVWIDEAGERFRVVGLPQDVFTSNKAEYLRVETDDKRSIDIRLDLIKEAYWVQAGIALQQARN